MADFQRPLLSATDEGHSEYVKKDKCLLEKYFQNREGAATSTLEPSDFSSSSQRRAIQKLNVHTP